MRLTFAAVAFLLSILSAARAAEPDVPPPLEPWRGWVLHGQEQRVCPFPYDRPGEFQCAWPGTLHLEATADGARFRQEWQVDAAGEVTLPGDAALWPQQVRLNGQPALVVERDGRPRVPLTAGTHRLEGLLPWQRLPEAVTVPPHSGLVALTIDGRPQPYPELDAAGRLWLRTAAPHLAQPQERLDLQVFRRLIDEVPARLVTRIELDVAGPQREVLLGPVLSEPLLPLRLDGPLPARLEPDRRLRVQVRPGRWVLTLEARHRGPVAELAPAAAQGDLWPAREVWVFDPRPWLRQTDVEGAPTIDPRQTALPADWQRLSAYLLGPGDRLRLVERRRGDPQPPPDRLHLERTLWLDFDGRGYTIADHLSGNLSASWRLESAPPTALGRVEVGDTPAFVTRLEADGPTGVEVRPGDLDLRAVSRVDTALATLPAVGWRHDVESLSATLHLPPGWRLIDIRGADHAETTWLARWSLLDLFAVLVVTLTTARLLGLPWGILALVTLTLAYHEEWAPRWVWLYLLATVALLRVLPQGGLRRATGLLHGAGVLALAVIAIPFALTQVRSGLYPGLERPFATHPDYEQEYAPSPLAAPMRRAPQPSYKSESLADESRAVAAPPPPPRYDPDTRVQTGPGLPQWQWTRAVLTWNGPVASGRQLDLLLAPPALNRPLAFLRVILVAALAAGILLGGGWRRRLPAPAALAGAALLLPLLGAWPGPAAAEPFPPQPLLDELKARLTAPPECLPQCATSPSLTLEVTADHLRLRQGIHAAAALAVPLPARAGAWLPQEVRDNGTPVHALSRDGNGLLWLRLAPGVHEVLLEGPLPARDTLHIPLPLRPHRVDLQAPGWQVSGLDPEGHADAQLELRREPGADAAPAPAALEPGVLPPFLRVERRLDLGLTWTVETRVVREGPPGQGVALAVPLLPGESVTSGHLRVEQGRARVVLEPQQNLLTWQSVLEPAGRLTLTAPAVDAWSEVWQVAVTPLWHARFDGLPPVRAPGAPPHPVQWRPWPGEQLTIDITRPAGVEGPTLTVEQAALQVTPGGESTRFELDLTLRSGSGTRHRLPLPAAAALQSVRIDGVEQPFPAGAGEVLLPLAPGEQRVEVVWHQEERMGTRYHLPALPLGADGANATLRLAAPDDRWVLFAGGPVLGPAVLFWGELLVVALVAVGLTRARLAPLRAHQWFLLGVGLTQVSVLHGALVVLWLLALGARCRLSPTGPVRHDLIQLGLALFTLVAFAALYQAIEQGLLGTPQMQVAGNGSGPGLLQWYTDRIPGALPSAWVVSLPLWSYRLLMLAWALWIANALIGWLRWGWECYGRDGLWQPLAKRPSSTRG